VLIKNPNFRVGIFVIRTMTDLKTFEFHRFVEGILHTQTKESFVIANQNQFNESSPDYPFRSYFYGIGLVYEGERSLRIGIEDYHLKAQDLLVIGPSIIRHWLDNRWDLKHTALFFTPDIFQSPINGVFLSESQIFRAGIQHVISLNNLDFEFFDTMLQNINQHRNAPKIVAPLIMAVVEKIESLHPENQVDKTKYSRKQQLSKFFCSLINTHYLENKEVAFYANKLNITPKYLSEVVKEETGKSPKNLIEQLLMQEAKSLLKQTEMNIKEISYWLGFDDPSYFTKAFKVSEGVLPNEYRNG
jgi:AraC family transcriptional regulator, transcriptional activator of pobA